MSGLNQVNAGLYRDWQRTRTAEGFRELPRNAYALASLQEHSGGRTLTALDRAAVLEWMGSLEAAAPSTRATYFSSARAFYNWASSEEEEIIPKSPMKGMKEPKNPKRVVPIPLESDIRKLMTLTEADKTPMGRRDTALFRIMCDTGGPRASEAAGILISGRPQPPGTPAGLGIDLDRDLVTVIGKGSKVRTFPIAARTATAAARWLRVRDGLRLADKHARLWHTFRSQQLPLTYSGVEQVLRRRCAQAGIEHLHPHQLRHFSYHHFLKRGGRLNDAMVLYGWDDDDMPRHYAAALEAERAVDAGNLLAIGDQW